MIIFILKDNFMTFRTKLDYSDNRQIKQRTRTNTTLSGTTVFGVPFSGLTTGASTTDSGATQTFTSVISTFSGNSGTTVFTWYDNTMSLGESQISALTPSNSGVTQNIFIFTPSSTTTIDGNTVNLAYTGVSFDLTVTNMIGSGPSYSGTVKHQQVSILSANTLDYTGRTIWVDNKEITRTKKIIVTQNPQVGYVLKCVDSEGKAEWGPVSGVTTFSGNTSATCINELYISNLYGCSPITIHDNLRHTGSTASGLLSVAFGNTNLVSGNYSFGHGTSVSATSTNCHAEGDRTIASTDASHAEGKLTIASGAASHAQNRDTTASGADSHAEGNGTIASGGASHAGGSGAVASGFGSFAHFNSNGTLGAYGDNSVVLGGANNSILSYAKSSGIFCGTANTINIYACESTILGGCDNDLKEYVYSSGIFCGTANTINANVERSVVIGGKNITGATNDTVYVPDLVIDGLINVTDLQTNGEGLLIDGASDVKLKKNISKIENSLEKIIKLNPVSFEWKKEMKLRTGRVYGLIAQEVDSVIPDVVRKRAKGNGTLTIEYKELIPWIISAIKELDSKQNVSTSKDATIKTKIIPSEGVNTKTNKTSSSDKVLNKKEVILETQTIASEDNNIELNFNGTKDSSVDGGIIVIKGVSKIEDAKFTINSDGDWTTNNYIIPKGIIIPEYTPKSTSDSFGKIGSMTKDDDYLYIKGNNGWGRCLLETF